MTNAEMEALLRGKDNVAAGLYAIAACLDRIAPSIVETIKDTIDNTAEQTGFRKTNMPLDILAKELYGKWDFTIGNQKPPAESP